MLTRQDKGRQALAVVSPLAMKINRAQLNRSNGLASQEANMNVARAGSSTVMANLVRNVFRINSAAATAFAKSGLSVHMDSNVL